MHSRNSRRSEPTSGSRTTRPQHVYTPKLVLGVRLPLWMTENRALEGTLKSSQGSPLVGELPSTLEAVLAVRSETREGQEAVDLLCRSIKSTATSPGAASPMTRAYLSPCHCLTDYPRSAANGESALSRGER